MRAAEPRLLRGWLILGVLMLPVVSAWLTLRRGYSRDVRLGAFLYLALAMILSIAR